MHKPNYNIPTERKLTSDQRVELVSLLATWHPPREVIAHFKEKYNITISRSNIQWYQTSTSHKPLFDRLRNDYLSGILEVPIAHKRVRLDRYENLFQQAQSQGNLKTAREVLESARTELEGKSSVSITMNRIEMLSDSELQERRQRLLEEIKNSQAIECQTVQ